MARRNIHFENYFLDDDIAENILNEVAKKYKLSKYMKKPASYSLLFRL